MKRVAGEKISIDGAAACRALVVGAPLALAGPLGANATTPTVNWLGVERIVVDCSIDDVRPADVRAQLCSAVLRQAQAVSRYPVVVMPQDRASDPRTAAERGDMVLHVRAHPAPSAIELELHLARSVLVQGATAGPVQRVSVVPGADVAAPQLRAAMTALFTPARPAGADTHRFKRAPLPPGVRSNGAKQ